MRASIKILREANVSVAQAEILLAVAEFQGRSLREYAELTNNVMSTTSRHMLDLGELNRLHEPGLGLVEQWPNPQDRRSNVYRLTPKGFHLVSLLTGEQTV